MKLYTEEQVNELRRALRDIAQWDEDLEDDWEDAGNRAMDSLRCFEKQTPIELPSDEEIEKEMIKWGLGDIGQRMAYRLGIKDFRNKIQGGNK